MNGEFDMSMMGELKRIFRYLKVTSELGFYYSKGNNFNLEGYTDADYVGYLVT